MVEFLAKHPVLYLVSCSQCMFGLTAPGDDGATRPVAKLTRWMTTSSRLAAALSRAKAAEVYPNQLCTTIVRAFRQQLRDETGSSLGSVEEEPVPPTWTLDLLKEDPEDSPDLSELNHIGADRNQSGWVASDDVKGGSLPAHLVQAARAKEMEYVQGRRIYKYDTTANAVRLSGKKPLWLKWIDTNKGGEGDMNVRSRIVCTEVRKKGVEPIFSATPPLETLRVLLTKAASRKSLKSGKALSIQLIDVSRAHFYADAVRDVFIQLPKEDPRASEPGVCGKLLKTMYGTLDAAERWGQHYTQVLQEAGFRPGAASPCHFWHAERDIWLLVHGDDFLSVADDSSQKFLEDTLRAVYEVKVSRAGPRPEDQKSLRVLGRIIEYTEHGLQCEPDPQHVEVVLSELNLTGAKGVATPGAREEVAKSEQSLRELRMGYCHCRREAEGAPDLAEESDDALEEESPLLEGDQLSLYQSLAARLNYFSLDRPDLLFPVKELMRKMAAPRVSDLTALKRVARYLRTAPRMVVSYPWEELSATVTAYIDANFAGCLRSRKSTVGGVLLWGGQFVRAWSKTMAVLALSSGESELAAVVKGAAEGLGLQSCLADFGCEVQLALRSDATAAIGMCRRQGLGRVRHLATADLWIQQKVRSRQLQLYKHPGTENPSDLMTKHKGRADIIKCLGKMRISELDGRASLAPVRAGTIPVIKDTTFRLES